MDFVGQFSKEMAFLPEEKLGPFKLAPERPKLVENTLHILGFLPWELVDCSFSHGEEKQNES